MSHSHGLLGPTFRMMRSVKSTRSKLRSIAASLIEVVRLNPPNTLRIYPKHTHVSVGRNAGASKIGPPPLPGVASCGVFSNRRRAHNKKTLPRVPAGADRARVKRGEIIPSVVNPFFLAAIGVPEQTIDLVHALDFKRDPLSGISFLSNFLVRFWNLSIHQFLPRWEIQNFLPRWIDQEKGNSYHFHLHGLCLLVMN